MVLLICLFAEPRDIGCCGFVACVDKRSYLTWSRVGFLWSHFMLFRIGDRGQSGEMPAEGKCPCCKRMAITVRAGACLVFFPAGVVGRGMTTEAASCWPVKQSRVVVMEVVSAVECAPSSGEQTYEYPATVSVRYLKVPFLQRNRAHVSTVRLRGV